MIIPVVSREEAVARVERFGLSDTLKLMLMFGTCSGHNGKHQVITCNPPGKDYAQVITVGVYKGTHGHLVDRFNVTKEEEEDHRVCHTADHGTPCSEMCPGCAYDDHCNG